MTAPVRFGEPAAGTQSDDAVEAGWALWSLADLTLPMAVRAITAVGVFDLIETEPRSAAQLAAATGTDEHALRRVLDLLVAHGVLSSPVAGHGYALTATSRLLRRDHPLSLADAYQPLGAELAAWSALEHSIRTGEEAFGHVHGIGHRAYRAANPDEDARMDRAHRAGTRIELLTMLRAYDWSSVRTVVDVGGGTGAFLAGLLPRFRHLHGVLFDLPQMVANADEIISAAGVEDRCRVVGGDFFADVPVGGDLYILKAVIGGWDDGSAVRILRSVRRVMRADARLLVIEPVLQYGPEYLVGSIVHLRSLVLYGGPDRTREHYEALSDAAGLRLIRVIPRPTLPLLELAPA